MTPIRVTVEFVGGPMDGAVGVVTGERVFVADGPTLDVYALDEEIRDTGPTPVMRHEITLAVNPPQADRP